MNIHENIQGKTIDAALTDGTQLILRMTDGHEYRIKWEDGEPVLRGVDVRIVIPAAAMSGVAGAF